MNTIDQLIQHFGNQNTLAQKLGLSQGAVSQWRTDKSKISPENALKIEKITDGKFRAVDLCPRLAELDK